jgi:hypothetical protein
LSGTGLRHRIPIVRAKFAYPRPAHASEYTVMFSKHLGFDATCTEIRFDAATLSAPAMLPCSAGMKGKAAVAWKAGAPLTIEPVDLEGPRAGEVLFEMKATGICHTDYYPLSGADPEGLFPAILGHEGAGVVVDVGPGVTHAEEGRPRHPALHAIVPAVPSSAFHARRTCASSSAAARSRA